MNIVFFRFHRDCELVCMLVLSSYIICLICHTYRPLPISCGILTNDILCSTVNILKMALACLFLFVIKEEYNLFVKTFIIASLFKFMVLIYLWIVRIFWSPAGGLKDASASVWGSSSLINTRGKVFSGGLKSVIQSYCPQAIGPFPAAGESSFLRRY